jgi:hypothetical protein
MLLSTPYPTTTCVTGYLSSQGQHVAQEDLVLALVLSTEVSNALGMAPWPKANRLRAKGLTSGPAHREEWLAISVDGKAKALL